MSKAGNTASLLGCICLPGYVCSYTKQILVQIHIANTTVAQFNASMAEALVQSVAHAANVDTSQVNIISVSMGSSLHRALPTVLVAKCQVHGSDYLWHEAVGHQQVTWQHAHTMSITRL
jgi:hypothetical protein